MARELKSIVVEGDKSADWLQREADKVPDFDAGTAEPSDQGKAERPDRGAEPED